MLSNLPTIGVRFNIKRIDSSCYGIACWKIFWQTIDPGQLPGALLFEGDTAGTLSDRENVFCIAVQCSDATTVEKVKLAMIQSDTFREVCARPRFVEGDQCVCEPLVQSDQIDSGGKLRTGTGDAAYALKSVRPQR